MEKIGENAKDQVVYFHKQHIQNTYLTAMSNEFVRMMQSFHSSFFYHIFSISARKQDSILGIRMVLLRLQL